MSGAKRDTPETLNLHSQESGRDHLLTILTERSDQQGGEIKELKDEIKVLKEKVEKNTIAIARVTAVFGLASLVIAIIGLVLKR